MKIAELLAELRSRDIFVWREEGHLQVNAPEGALDPGLRERLRQRKDEILQFLDGPAELSFSQQRMWLLGQLDPAGAAYVIVQAMRMKGRLDTGALETALAKLVERHESLRTVFNIFDGQPMQVVKHHATWTLPQVDLSGTTDGRLRLDGLVREEAARGFDLTEGPLFRARLFGLATDEYVLLLTIHDSVADGWSLHVLMRELGALYKGLTSGQVVNLPPVRLRYRDFARWQRAWLQDGPLQSQLAHWKSRLAGAPLVLELPTDRARPPVESHRGALHSFILPVPLVQAVRALARKEGATQFIVLLACFALLLARYSGQRDLLVGTPVANRSRTELEDIVGCFVNTLVVRADLSGEPSVRELLRRVRESCLDAYAHQDLPFERLVAEIHPERNTSRNTMFQAMFLEQPAAAHALQLPGVALEPMEVDKGTAQFDLTLEVQETPQGLKSTIEYATDLFEASTIERMVEHWRLLLEAMVASPERSIWELPMLSAAERQQVLGDWSGATKALPSDRCLHELIAEQAVRSPEAIAVVSGGRGLSYVALERRANQLAHALRKRGVGPEVLVGLCVRRSADMIVALLGVLKAGGAYVPLDPDYPGERLAFLLEDCGAKVIVTEERLRASLPPLPAGCQVFSLDQEAAALALEPGTAPDSGVGPASLAYAIYTSGSTGLPKAALLTHAGLSNLAQSEFRLYGVGPRSRVLQFASLSFDTSLSDIAMALCSGATLHVEARETLPLGPDLERYLARERITVLSLTPSALAVLDPAAGPALEQVIVGGEACPPELAARWCHRCRFFNAYGPTETAVTATYAEYRKGFQPPLIGKPLPNVRTYLLDERLEPVPAGVPGELYIGGAGVARGYLKRPELTAARFVTDPFAAGGEARMYRSGDFARWRSDGQIEFIGRRDDQIKIRGFRVELGEIEAAISRLPSVQACAVVARGSSVGDRSLAGYVVMRKDAPADMAALRTELRRHLPEYMVPAHLVALESLPSTLNGKVDRKALPDPTALGIAAGASVYVAPRNDLEISMASVWQGVLGVPQVGITDNFFDLGGNSLSAVRLVFEVKQATGIQIDLGEIFRSPTIAELVKSLGPDAIRNTSVVVPLQPEGDGLPVFCICGINIYRAFAESLGKDQPVYGVYVAEEQAIVDQVIRGETPKVSIDQLVDAYYEAIRRFRPQGPYRLAGLSFGGILAMELASRMRKSGAEVDLVFLLDAILPKALRFSAKKWLSRQMTDILNGHGPKKLRRLLGGLPARFADQHRPASKKGQKIFFDALLANGQDILFSRASIAWQDRPSDYDFKAILFRATDLSLPAHLDVDEDYGWRRYLGNRLSIVDAVGGHRGIIEKPNVAELGRVARGYLG